MAAVAALFKLTTRSLPAEIALPRVPTTVPPTLTLAPEFVLASATVPLVERLSTSSAESSPEAMVTVRLPPLKLLLSTSANTAAVL